MNIEKNPYEDRERITQTYMTDYYYNDVTNTYYKRWGIRENEHPIEGNAFFLTYRGYNSLKSQQPILDRFKDLYHWQLKRMMSTKRSVKYVYERQHVGMAAVDYNGSSLGRWVPAEGAHVHSVIVIHPEFRLMTIVWLNMIKHELGSDFYYKRVRENGHSIRSSIHYCLKGIMNERGYYKGRDDLSIFLGPRKEKFQSKVVRVGRVPVLKKPIFKLRTA